MPVVATVSGLEPERNIDGRCVASGLPGSRRPAVSVPSDQEPRAGWSCRRPRYGPRSFRRQIMAKKQAAKKKAVKKVKRKVVKRK